MCSIIGTSKLDDKFKENIDEYFKTLAHRGTDSYGYIFLNRKSKQFELFKSLTKKDFIDKIKELPNNGALICHARKASVGAVDVVNAHPVKSSDNTVWLIHNGTNKTYADFYDASSDSQGLASLIEAVSEDKLDGLLNDLGVVFFTKNSHIYFYKDELRPLCLNKESGIFASEPLFDGKWALIKEQMTPVVFDFTFDTKEEFELELGLESYCTTCKKRHIKQKKKALCAVCKLDGKLEPTSYTSSYNTRTSNDIYFTIPRGTTGLVVTRNMLVEQVDKVKLSKDIEYSVNFTYDRVVYKATKNFYVSIVSNSCTSYMNIDVEKFVKKNKDILSKFMTTEPPKYRVHAGVKYKVTKNMSDKIKSDTEITFKYTTEISENTKSPLFGQLVNTNTFVAIDPKEFIIENFVSGRCEICSKKKLGKNKIFRACRACGVYKNTHL